MVIFMFREMRRKDRELSIKEAKEILLTGKYGVLSVLGEDGYPYGIPLHYAVINDKLYFHSTIEGGHKADALKNNPKISFTVIEPLEGVRCRSAIVFGTAKPVSGKRAEVLEKIVEKFVPQVAWEQAKGGIPFAVNNIKAYEITIEHLTAKVVDKPEGR